MQIPSYLEKLIHEGKAVYKTLSMGACQELILPVPEKSYVVLYGYEYLPMARFHGLNEDEANITAPFRFFAGQIQYVNILNDSNFYTYSHALEYINLTADGNTLLMRKVTDHQKRSCYIVAKKDLAIYFTELSITSSVLTTNILNQDSPILPNLGYAGLSAVTSIQQYINAVGQVFPLTNKYSIPAYSATPSDFNQLSTGLDAGFAPLDLTGITGDFARGNSRANLILLHYVEIFEEAPQNLI